MNCRIARTVYEPLDEFRLQFWLLEIAEPDDDNEDGPVVVKMHTVSLQDRPPFAALSYVWGDPTETAEIIVNGSPRKETRTASGQPSGLWADAICINQENVEEKSHQVGMMGRIYSSASLVVAWLSNEDKGLPLVFSALETLCREVKLVNAGHVDALHGVTWMEDHDNDLFRLVQFQRDPKERAGDPSLQLYAVYFGFPTGKGCGSSRSWGKGLATKKPNEDAKKSELLDALFYMGQYKYLPQKPNFDRILDKQFESLSSPEADSSGHSNYYSALLSLKGFQHDATDARDHVYGLLSLTGLNIIPDYSKTTRQVLLDYVRAIISSNRGTDSELCFLDTAPQAPHSDTDNLDLPSWTPSRFSYDHCRADRPCHATRGVFHGYDFPEPEAHGRSLSAGGSRIQRIKRVVEIPDNNMPWRAEGKSLCDPLEEFASGGRAAYHTGCSTPRALRPTVLCKTNGDADTSPFLVYFRKGAMTGEHNLGQRLQGGVDNETRLCGSMKDPTMTVLFNWGLGLMDGEAKTLLQEGHCETQMFELV
ncbi:hypothetical protein INS49_010628 [Diaporthe citri]|uniref:uncharacterized protein n=1 Tax=Diaporthe citri TaxID=83186 RepID=UPI001C805FD9|nr:uncharacterized protein INS49_010628 [Diaporthe citri]KAG6362398.1 hypothetical protein INS49_010628 [Diaporthe citri]